MSQLFGIGDYEDFDNFRFRRKLAIRYGYNCNFHDGLGERKVPRLPELVPCPAAFDFPGVEMPGRYYIEPLIYLARKQSPFPWERLDESRPLIYCGLGSWLFFGKSKYRRFSQTVIDASEIRPNWQWVLSVGDILTIEELESVPPNVIIVNQAPQLELLKCATMMITHGGSSTIKECIYFGVPMIIFPFVSNAVRGNAARAVYHGLGVQGDLRKLSVTYLQNLIETVDKNSYFRSQVKIMQRKFREMEDAGLSVKPIETILAA